MPEDKTFIKPKGLSPTSNSRSGTGFSSVPLSKLYQFFPPPLKTVSLSPLFSSDNNNGGGSTLIESSANSNSFPFTQSLPTFESFDLNIPDFNSVLADKVEDWIAQHTKALILGVGLGTAVSVGLGVGLLAIGFPQWGSAIYKRTREWLVRNHLSRLFGTGNSTTSESDEDDADYSVQEKINGRQQTGEIREAELDKMHRMIHSSSEVGESDKRLNHSNDRQPLAPGRTVVATLGHLSSSNRIIIIQGNPQTSRYNHDTSSQQHLTTTDQSIIQCRECLDSVTATLGKNMLTWNSVGRISVHVVLSKCTGATFRSVLMEYPISEENMIVTVYIVERLEDKDAWVQVEALASG